jgi:hypothetical protein
MKAAAMLSAYDETFSRLARSYRVTIVAGSFILPSPTVEQGRLQLDEGPLYNASVVYGPDGAALGLARKVHPTGAEQPFCAGARPDALPVLETPAGRLGVLVCAESWSPALYRQLKKQRPDLVAVPSFGGETGVWNAPWKGYDGQKPPANTDRGDVGTITEKQAWLKYALPARLKESGARAGLNVFSRGRLWGYRGDAQTLAVSTGSVHVRPLGPREGGALINLWL